MDEFLTRIFSLTIEVPINIERSQISDVLLGIPHQAREDAGEWHPNVWHFGVLIKWEDEGTLWSKDFVNFFIEHKRGLESLGVKPSKCFFRVETLSDRYDTTFELYDSLRPFYRSGLSLELRFRSMTMRNQKKFRKAWLSDPDRIAAQRIVMEYFESKKENLKSSRAAARRKA
jgi:hypothetical protein